MKPSTVSENKNIDTNIRKSDTAWLSLNDPVVRRVTERCIAMTDRPLGNCEKLQVLRYREGGFYRPHLDTIRGHQNKRMYTFILALNDEYEGGSTAFPNINKIYKLKKGDVLFFDTLDNYEMETSKALHSGTKVISGEKWIANLWIHKYDFTPGN
jgi:prolyl 4-hydroxylase